METSSPWSVWVKCVGVALAHLLQRRIDVVEPLDELKHPGTTPRVRQITSA